MATPLAPPPPVGQDVDSRQFRDWFYSLYALLGQPGQTLGTMAYQNDNSVAITGGAIGGVGITGSTVNNTPIGQTFAAAGRFTNLQADGTVSGAGFTNYFASPPPLGSTTPNRVNTNALKTTALTGYLYGNDNTGDVTASTTIPWSVITGTPSFISPAIGAFHYDYTTTLTSSISSSVTTIPVASTTGFSSTGAIIIGYELITYTGITSNSFTGCTRGSYGSNAASHASGLYVGGAQGTTANTATLLQINTTDISNGVTITASSEAQVARAGTFNIQFSVQTFNCGNAPDNFHIWYRLNGSDVPNSTSIQTTPAVHSGIPGAAIVTVNLFLTLAANDKVQLYWATDSGDTTVVTYPPSTASPVHPASPAVILTVNQVA